MINIIFMDTVPVEKIPLKKKTEVKCEKFPPKKSTAIKAIKFGTKLHPKKSAVKFCHPEKSYATPPLSV